MAKAYRFDDFTPVAGSSVSAFRSLSALRRFVGGMGSAGSIKIWEIDGSITGDDGGPDGITIVVRSVRLIR